MNWEEGNTHWIFFLCTIHRASYFIHVPIISQNSPLSRCYVHFIGEGLRLEILNSYQNSHSSAQWRWCSNTGGLTSNTFSFTWQMPILQPKIHKHVHSFIQQDTKTPLYAQQSKLLLSHSFLFGFNATLSSCLLLLTLLSSSKLVTCEELMTLHP